MKTYNDTGTFFKFFDNLMAENNFVLKKVLTVVLIDTVEIGYHDSSRYSLMSWIRKVRYDLVKWNSWLVRFFDSARHFDG